MGQLVIDIINNFNLLILFYSTRQFSAIQPFRFKGPFTYFVRGSGPLIFG